MGTAVAIALSFVCGYALSSLFLLCSGISVGWVLCLVLAANTVSLFTMKVVENLVMWLGPWRHGRRPAGALFCGSLALPLVIAYCAVYPVNAALLRRGKRHAITHHASGSNPMDNRPLVYGSSAFMLGGFVASLGTLL